MACSCQTRIQPQYILEPVPPPPHQVLPGESCIFCADKHISTAYTKLTIDADWPIVIGDLELARRHTAVEYPAISLLVARALYNAILRDKPAVLGVFKELLPAVESVLADKDPDAVVDGAMFEDRKQDAGNPLIGEMHLYAAYRLTFEVGYMVSNRSMIIGDLTLAREHLTRVDYGLSTNLRELRHRVQTTRASDINIYWVYVCGELDKWMRRHLEGFMPTYSDGLKAYLGV